MSRDFEKLIERQIAKAKAEGQLDGLKGEGVPLPDHPEEAYVDAGTAAGHRIMAQAGVVPEEIELKKKLDAALAELTAATDGTKKAAMTKVADLQMCLSIARDARRKFFK